MHRKSSTIALAALAALLLVPTVAEASPVDEVAAKLPAPNTPQQAVLNRAALQPAVDAAVRAGEGPALLQSQDPDVLAALMPYVTTSSVTSGPPRAPWLRPPAKPTRGVAARRRARAHSSGCWGWVSRQYTWTVAGGTVAWIYVRASGWCGNGYAMTWLGGATFAHWTWGIFCLGGIGRDYSWDGWPTWVHMATWSSLGISYPWGCGTYAGGKAVVRIAANGYFDFYNDYGF